MNPWEQEIMVALAMHLRVMSLEQIARVWWEGQRTAARRARETVRARQENGWLKLANVFARGVSALEVPLIRWAPGAGTPDFESTSVALRRRARKPAGQVQVVTATRKARQIFGEGGGARRLKLTQLTHDLQVAEIYFRYRASGFDLGNCWIGEDHLPKPWPVEARPDALLRGDGGRIYRALEYGGEYTVDRLMDLHGSMARIPLAYEIW